MVNNILLYNSGGGLGDAIQILPLIETLRTELKNQQKMATVYKWHRQASKDTKLTPVVVCKMNTRDPLVILDLDHFMSLIR